VATMEEIESRQNEIINEAADLLNRSHDDAIIILRHFKWDVNKIPEIWFGKEDKLGKEIGVIPANPPPKTTMCEMCYDDLDEESDGIKCKHNFHSYCWSGYLKTLIEKGIGCVESNCPKMGCNMTIPYSMFKKYLDPKDFTTYKKYHCRSFTDDNKSIRWCPDPGCDFVTEKFGGGNKQIYCKCGNVFCFGCNKESHRPIECDTCDKWLHKNTTESENVTWILANTKQCPKCHKPIEKNQGCNHMTCSASAGCKYEFCWLCLGDWKEHNSGTGGSYNCNKYEKLKDNEEFKQKEQKQQDLKNELEKYIFYFERFNNHHNSLKSAKLLAPTIEQNILNLHKQKQYPIQELDFLREGLATVIECRRVLKWTYASGYYTKDIKEKNLLEFCQENLEKNCERLHELVESPMTPYLDENNLDRKDFYQYKSDLINYCHVTKQFYKNLLEAIETGLTKTTH